MNVTFTDHPGKFPDNTIISALTRDSVSFDEMMSDLRQVDIVYVGEVHTDRHHHARQLDIIRELHKTAPTLTVGMEMFSTPYQPILNQWSAGEIDEAEFLKRSHWYANWKYRFSLYRDILLYIRENQQPLVALNIPFHIPAKIATGGIDSLLADDKKYLPKKIDLSNQTHRAYVEKIFSHHHLPGRKDFERFFSAQCVWDEAMAETISRNPANTPMVVLVGNGHIIHKFGIPNRAYDRTGATFRTIYLIEAGSKAELSYADYIWVTPNRGKPNRMALKFS
ncbi:MAG: ChaN family lipoprotein [Deltaproteobacteria bacterium]|nr:ChaN family lipoprotein [Deltaproteobacteria bacterium]